MHGEANFFNGAANCLHGQSAPGVAFDYGRSSVKRWVVRVLASSFRPLNGTTSVLAQWRARQQTDREQLMATNTKGILHGCAIPWLQSTLPNVSMAVAPPPDNRARTTVTVMFKPLPCTGASNRDIVYFPVIKAGIEVAVAIFSWVPRVGTVVWDGGGVFQQGYTVQQS